jgi:iron only hydrogenase large subunit-like protein
MDGFGGSVFLADLDADFISPSQACVNPLFTGTAKKKGSVNDQIKQTNPRKKSSNINMDSKNLRKTGAATLSIDSSIFSGIDTVVNSNQKKVARVTLNDCLACSGCVTSAETVLVTSHSIARLKQVLQNSRNNDNTLIFVLSVSPHARASIAEHYKLDLTAAQRALESVFKYHLGFHYIFGTEGATKVAREEVAAEFLHRLNQEQINMVEQTAKKKLKSNVSISSSIRMLNRIPWKRPRDTVAVSSTEAIYADTAEKYTHNYSIEHQPLSLPLLTSSCPGWICYAEKKCPEVLPYLSTCKSPQQILGRVLKGYLKDKLISSAPTNINDISSNINDTKKSHVYHVTLMPCYDKKLEASRKDFLHGSNNTPDVDLVITPKEFIEMVKADGIIFNDPRKIPVDKNNSHISLQFSNNIDKKMKVFLGFEASQVKVSRYDETTSGSSGGYLDYVLRNTALKLYNMNLFNVKNRLIFKTGKNKDFKTTEISYNDKVVLRFAIAYGFRNIQAIVRQLKKGICKYDFIEMMACPSGCLNGGAQIVAENRILTKALLEKVKMLHDAHVVDEDSIVDDECFSEASYHRQFFNMQPYTNMSLKWFHTKYHSVADLKLETAMGGDW